MEQERLEESTATLGETNIARGLLRRLVSILSEPLMLVETDRGGIAALNDEAAAIVGDYNELDALPVESPPEFREALAASIGSRDSLDWSVIRDGRPVRVRFSPILNGDGVSLVRLKNIDSEVDRNRRREVLQNNLERAERFDAAGRVAGVVAHEFNNILSIILNHADLLREGGDLEGESLEDAEQIRAAALEAAELTRRLLLFGRNDMSKPQFVRVEESIAGIVDLFAERHGVQVETDVRLAANSSVWVHPVRWSEAILHLLRNALEASDGIAPRLRAHAVEISVDHPAGIAPGNYVEFVIADDGAGMSEAVARRAFEPFFTTKDGLGAGLGLSVAYGIATSLGGHIEIDSNEGDGTAVTMLLPKHEQAQDSPDAPPDETEQNSTVDAEARTILVVEDEPGVLRAVQRILISKGYVLLTASSGNEALSVIEEHEGTIDLLLTDVVMPGMSGVQLAKRVMRKLNNIKVLYMSGYTESALSLDQLVAGKTDLILKPFTATDLLEVVEFQLER